jgi:hypothetical protein
LIDSDFSDSGTRDTATNGSASNGSEALDALAADFNAAEDLSTIPSAPTQDVSIEGAESQTDVFARIDEPIAERPNSDGQNSEGQDSDSQSGGSSPAAVPTQQRTGLRAFAERAMGGR